MRERRREGAWTISAAISSAGRPSLTRSIAAARGVLQLTQPAEGDRDHVVKLLRQVVGLSAGTIFHRDPNLADFLDQLGKALIVVELAVTIPDTVRTQLHRLLSKTPACAVSTRSCFASTSVAISTGTS